MGSDCPSFICGSGLTVRETGSPVVRDLMQRRRKLLFEQIALPRWASLRRPSFLHIPWYEGPWRAACPLIINVHDLDTLLHPHRYSPHFRLYYNGLLRQYARSARAILVLSENTAEDVVRHLRPTVRPDIIPLGPADEFRRADRSLGRALLKELGVSDSLPVAVSASGVGLRKNLGTLGRALEVVHAAGVELALVVTQTDRIPEALKPAANAGVPIIAAGFLERQDVANLLAAAEVSICPSFYEGFGLAVIESMAAGCPVIASKAGSHPEVVGDAAVLFETEEPSDLAACIRAILSDSNLAASLRSRGRERASGYSWDEAVRRTIEVYERFG
ncbi:glycosyltransferase family 1 protein [Candidatus Aeolococcus gillhamiae]